MNEAMKTFDIIFHLEHGRVKMEQCTRMFSAEELDHFAEQLDEYDFGKLKSVTINNFK